MSDERRHPRPGEPVRGSSTGRPIMALLDILGRRWTLRILWELHLSSPQPLTFRALQARCDHMSSSVLNHRLGEMRDARLVANVTGGYSLAPDSVGLVDLLLPLNDWAQSWRPQARQGQAGNGAPTAL